LIQNFSSKNRQQAPLGAQESSNITLSLIITAHNEESRIREKIENSLLIEYHSLELIVASDGSTDKTDAIVEEYQARGVKLVRPLERLGKENAQKCAIEAANGNTLVFSDVATMIPVDGLLNLSRYFKDPTVGAVSSEDRFLSDAGEVAGEGAYVKYEMWLRAQESKLAGLVGLSGSFFAAREEVCRTWDIESPSDFNTALNCSKLAYRSLSAPDVLGYYKDLKDPANEYARKVRTVIRGMTALHRHPELLNPLQFGLFSFQVFGHKLMRWLVPWFLIALFLVTATLAPQHYFFSLAFLVQGLFYGLALSAHFSTGLRAKGLVKIIYFFMQANVAVFDASCQFLSGTRVTVWQPSVR